MLLLLIICSLSGTGCLATKYKIIRQSLTPVPQDAQGLLYVATNRRIPVGVEGTEAIAHQDVGGYYLVHKRDWAALMQALRAGRERAGRGTESGPTAAPTAGQKPPKSR